MPWPQSPLNQGHFGSQGQGQGVVNIDVICKMPDIWNMHMKIVNCINHKVYEKLKVSQTDRQRDRHTNRWAN